MLIQSTEWYNLKGILQSEVAAAVKSGLAMFSVNTGDYRHANCPLKSEISVARRR